MAFTSGSTFPGIHHVSAQRVRERADVLRRRAPTIRGRDEHWREPSLPVARTGPTGGPASAHPGRRLAGMAPRCWGGDPSTRSVST